MRTTTTVRAGEGTGICPVGNSGAGSTSSGSGHS